MKKVNWGIIGLGAIAKQFAKGFENLNNSNYIKIFRHTIFDLFSIYIYLIILMILILYHGWILFLTFIL